VIRTVLTLLVFTSPLVAADHWPAWRGPTANGVAPKSADPPTTWDEKTNLKWKIELPGRGSATPAVWGNKVFVLTAVETDREAKPDELPKLDPKFETRTTRPTKFYAFWVLCYDLATGNKLWEVKATEAVPHEGHHETHSYAAGSPAVDAERVYACFGSFGLFVFDHAGKPVWNREFGRLNTRLGWGEAITPVVHQDTLLLNLDQEANSKLVALDAATGKPKWETPREEKSTWTTPLVVEHGNTTQVLMNGTNRARSYDLATGKELWAVGGMTGNAIPTPVAADGVAYFVSGYRGAAAVAVPLDSKGDLGADGKGNWRYGKGTPYVPSPVLFDGRLYFTQGNTGTLTVLDAKTGKPLLEAEKLPKLTGVYASPLVAAGRLYIAGRDGTTVVLSATDKPEVLATNKLDDTLDASPVAVGKTLLLRGHKHLYAVEAK
jgi:outer membrane protein assembly factor BamB